MKKFLFFLLFLIILGGTGFFLGWAHLTVPPGSYGVMRSKTHGLENEVIRDGEFRWIWYKMLPTNAEVSVYTLGPVRRQIRSAGSLSSGQSYAAMAGLEADFSWEISGEITFSLKPDLLPELTVRENINDNEGLRKAEERLAERIESFVLKRLRAYAEGEDERKMEAILLAGSLPELDNEIQRTFPEIENLNCTIRVIRYPDYALYQSVKALHRDFLARQNAVLTDDITREAEKRINMRIRLDELALYGELLTRYPILLQFLALEKGFPPGEVIE
jgi:hypothetical protein